VAGRAPDGIASSAPRFVIELIDPDANVTLAVGSGVGL
jgi:hypothetical protein